MAQVTTSLQAAKDDLHKPKEFHPRRDRLSPCSEPLFVLDKCELAFDAEHYRDTHDGIDGATLTGLRERNWAPASTLEMAAAVQVLADELWAVVVHIQKQGDGHA